MRATLSILLVSVACATPKAPQRPAGTLAIRESPVVVRGVLVSTPTPVPAPAATEGLGLASSSATIELTLVAAFDCDDPKAAFTIDELEGSILGSNGIDRAVTYVIPKLATDRCRPATAPREYVLALPWSRRSDTPWTIVVTPYAGEANRVAGTGLFAQDLTGYTAPRAPRADAVAVTATGESLTNAPAIKQVSARREAGDIVITLDLVYGNPCSAKENPWILDATSSRSGDVAFVWATLVRSGSGAPCGEIFSPTPVTAVYRMPAPQGARSVSVAIPNVNAKDGLPIFREQIAL